MRREEAIEKLDKLTGADQEDAHIQADDILCEVLLGYGFKDVVDAYKRAGERVHFWYA